VSTGLGPTLARERIARLLYDIDHDDDTQAVAELGRAIGTDLLAPCAAEVERTGRVPDHVLTTLTGTGLIAPVGAEHGGDGMPRTSAHLHFVEALAAGDPTCAAAAVWAGAASLILHRVDAPDLLAQIVTRPDALAVAMHEGYGRAPSEYVTETSPRVRGEKVGVSIAGAPDALVVVGARSLAVIDAGSTGATHCTNNGQLGMDAAQLCTVTIDTTPSRTIDATDGLVFGISHVRLLSAAIALGTAQRATEYAAEYANGRIAFGKPISSFQGVSFLLAESALRIGAAHLEMIEVARQIDAVDNTKLEARTTKAVNYACHVAMGATRDAVQVLGGHGFITDHPVERWYRAAATLASLDCDPLHHVFEAAL
jgi:alkylation response protein AidB-like acyl-CoA dehydrogenase